MFLHQCIRDCWSEMKLCCIQFESVSVCGYFSQYWVSSDLPVTAPTSSNSGATGTATVPRAVRDQFYKGVHQSQQAALLTDQLEYGASVVAI